ncbi:MAG: hypothetical protein WBY88_00685 [Desulfosarcina sp.]
MRFGSGTVERLIGVLLTAVVIFCVAPYAAADPFSPLTVDRRMSSVFSGEVAMMWLHVVQDGQPRMMPFSADELAGMSRINVDGYINGVVLLSTSPLTLSVARQPMIPIRHNSDGTYDVKYFGRFSRDEFWSTFVSDACQAPPRRRIQGYYSSFARVPGNALSDQTEFRISVAHDGLENHLTLRHKAQQQIEASDLPVADAGTPQFFYLGGCPSRFGGTDDAVGRRMQAILAGIRAVEWITGGTLVDRVHVIDYERLNNAYTCEGVAEIWFYAPLFWNESLDELRTIAEHETLHILSDRLGFAASSRMRERFAALKGYDPFSLETFFVVTTGRTPARPGTGAAGSGRLFDFINEANFMRGMKGGHAQDDVDEFCASFLHSLVYIDRLEERLGQPVKTRRGTFATLAARDRVRLLDDYRTVLETMAAEIPRGLPPGMKDVFLNGLEVVRGIGATVLDRGDVRELASLPP